MCYHVCAGAAVPAGRKGARALKQRTIERQLYSTLIGGIAIMLLISISITLYYSIYRQKRHVDRTIADTAAIVAHMPQVLQTLQGQGDPEELKEYLNQVLALSSVEIITVCDAAGVRLYHPNEALIGKRFVGGDEQPALEGADPYITTGRGTLGEQRRAFCPVRDDSGRVAGFVMTSMLIRSMVYTRGQILAVYLVFALLLALIALVVVRQMMRRLRRTLMGHGPEEFAAMYLQQSGVLDALDEGVFAIDRQSRVILMNSSARRMLDIPPGQAVEGALITELFPETRLPQVMESGRAQNNVIMDLRGRRIITSRIPLCKDGVCDGAVSVFRDKTEVTRLAEELTGTRFLVDTLRAYNHEFNNKLHVILGYIQMGRLTEAVEFITRSTLLPASALAAVSERIAVPHLAALILGKMIRAKEKGILLTLKPDSRCMADDLIIPPEDCETIVGNLLENAIEELDRRDHPVKEISLGVYCSGQGLLIQCEDTGGGIPPQVLERIFEQGVSTKGENRGTGLSLVHSIVEAWGGQIQVDTELDEGTGITVSIATQAREASSCIE